MDKTDRQILRILQQNARITITQISQKVGLSPPSVTERLRKLETEGAVLGYHARVEPLALGKNICAYIGVNVQPERQARFIRHCECSSCIVSYFRVIGVFSAILYVVAQNSSQLEEIIDELKQYGTTQTSVVLSTPFQDKPIE